MTILDQRLSPPSPDGPYLKDRPTVNPYRVAAGQLARRLRWDLKPESWRSRGKLRRLKDVHVGEKAVILCNGPSLNRVDLSSLAGTYCFGLNKINLLFSRTEFRPSSIVAVDAFSLEQNRAFFNETSIPLFLSEYGTKYVRPAADRIFMPISLMRTRFARDCSMSVCTGYTVTFVALQLAYHMGFSDVALVGCDHNYQTKGSAGLVVKSGEVDADHFDPAYFSNEQRGLPNLIEQSAAYQLAYNVYGGSGRRLVNATDGGHLELLPRMTLAQFLGS